MSNSNLRYEDKKLKELFGITPLQLLCGTIILVILGVLAAIFYGANRLFDCIIDIVVGLLFIFAAKLVFIDLPALGVGSIIVSLKKKGALDSKQELRKHQARARWYMFLFWFLSCFGIVLVTDPGESFWAYLEKAHDILSQMIQIFA